MVNKYKIAILLGGGLLILFVSLISGLIFKNEAETALIGLILAIIGFIGSVAYLVGCWLYAKSKGYSGALGLILGLFIIGILILAVLPDKTKNNQKLQTKIN